MIGSFRYSATIWWLLPLGILICASGCGNRHFPGTDDEGPEVSLRRASAEWDVLFNARSTARLASLYAQDAYTMPPESPTIKGRESVRNGFERFFADYDAHNETQIDEFLIGEDRAIELAHYTLRRQLRPDGDEEIQTGRRVICRRKTPVRWEIVWEMWNTDIPPGK